MFTNTLKTLVSRIGQPLSFLSLKRLLVVSFIALAGTVDIVAQVHVKGYYRKDGTYVRPHYRSSPDGNPYNNWSYPGNTNPYTGKVATGNPSTYLNNYYHRNGRYYSHRTATLFNTNFRKLERHRSYRITGHSGEQIGMLRYHSGNHFMIVDGSNDCVGWVRMRGPNSYTIVDASGYRVRSKGGGGGIAIGFAALALLVVAIR